MRQKRGESANFALSHRQVEAVLAACLDLYDRIIIGLQLFCGLRISEVCHLRADWITQEGDIRIPERMPCNCAECARKRRGLWKSKSKAGARTLPIPKRLKKDLGEIIKMKPHGIGISRVGLYYRTKTILKRARIRFEGTSDNTAFPHALRATCLNMLVEGGMSVAGLAYFAGWSNIAVASHYVSLVRARGLAAKEARSIFG